MNRIAPSITLALGLLAAGLPASADGPETGPRPRPPASAPPWYAEAPEGGASPLADLAGDGGLVAAKGLRSYSEERALADARARLERAVAAWLAPDVPEGWAPPAALIDALIVGRHVEPVALDPGRLGLADDPALDLPRVLYIGALRAEFSPERRAALVEAHRRQVGDARLALLGGAAAFALSCLAILSLYIRADEATRGYYTGRLRVLAVAAAGAAGAVIYRLVA